MTATGIRLAALAALLTAATSAQAAILTLNPRSGGAGAAGTIELADPATSCASGTVCPVTFTGPVSYTLTYTLVNNARPPIWVGCSSVVAGNCVLTNLTTNRTVTATFPADTWPLTVRPASSNGGTGTVTVAVVPPVVCTDTAGCTANVPAGTTVAVTQSPGTGSTFTGWSGACTSTGACNVLANATKTVNANYTRSSWPVTVGFFGNGGSVTGSGFVTGQGLGTASAGTLCTAPAGASSDCAGLVANNGNATITASPDAMSDFVGWSGCASTAGVNGEVCNLTAVRTAKNPIASFQAKACNSCHGTPPATTSHTTSAVPNCGGCHGGYTFDSVNPAVHLNGVIDFSGDGAPNGPSFVAGTGLAVEVLGVNSIAGGARPSIRVKITDETGAPFDVAGEIVPVAPAALAKLRSLSFSIAQLEASGSWFSKIGSAATSTSFSTSESGTGTAAVPRYVPVVGQDGVYDYTFAAYVLNGSVPAVQGGPYDANKRTRVAVFGSRWSDGTADGGVTQYPAWNSYELVPSGGTAATHDVVANAKCQGCHGYTNVNIHGLNRGFANACEICHTTTRGTALLESPTQVGLYTKLTPTATAAAGLWDFKNMVHGVHNGQVLKGGTASTTATTSVSDFSLIKMAPSHSMYFELGTTGGLPVIEPEITTQCEICHSGADAVNAYTKPTRVACGSCHTNVNFTSGAGHDGALAGPQADDSACANCHAEAGNRAVHGRFYEPAHKTNFVQELASNPIPMPAAGHDFQVNLVSVTASGTGALTYTVDFALDGQPFSVNPLPDTTFRLSTCAFQIAGPTQSDYTTPATGGTAQSCTTVATWTATATPGRFTYTGSAFLNGKPDGDYTAAFEIAIQRVVTVPAGRPGAGDVIRKPFSANPNFLTLTKSGGATAVVAAGGTPRRAVVDFAKCNNCHVDLGFHSNRGRKGPDYCATCHNPMLDNSGRARFTVAEAYQIPGQPAGTIGYLPESVSMNVFIHRIHMGDELSSVVDPANKSPLSAYRDPAIGKIAYGATRSAFVGLDASTPPEITDFSHFAMPNPMSRCDQCHVSMATAALPTGTRAPVQRYYRLCNPVTVTWDTVQWCNVTATSGAPAAGVTVVTPPMKAVCTSCHDSAGADAHADSMTTNPMTAGAVEQCAACHAGQTHRPTFNGGTTFVP